MSATPLALFLSLVKLHPVIWMRRLSLFLSAVMMPLGIWGLGGLALLDSALIPIPGSMDGVLVKYVHDRPHEFLLLALMAAAASTLGSLVPFYVGRGGGELVLLKRINRERYERMRDRFERQEFFAIMIPSMGPPPTPLKLFQFAAGVFEMRVGPFLLATFLGKFLQYGTFAVLTVWLGPTIFARTSGWMHRHTAAAFGLGGLLLLGLAFWAVRKVFDRRRGTDAAVDGTDLRRTQMEDEEDTTD